MKIPHIAVFGATLASSICSVAHAGNLTPPVSDPEALAAMSNLATLSETTEWGAYSFTPIWSEQLGFAATGALGYELSDNSAIGIYATTGERQRELLVNVGSTIDSERQIVLSFGQLQEKLEYGASGAQEWLKQAEYGLAYDAQNYAFNVYHVDSESTNNFVGAKSTGADVEGSKILSRQLTVNYSAGYQTLHWDDGTKNHESLTARVGLDYQATPDVLLNAFADHNVSENQIGISAKWKVGNGTLSAQLTHIDGNVGSVADDNRIALSFSMPIGGSQSVVSKTNTKNLKTITPEVESLVSDVMQRPNYLPKRVIAKVTSRSACELSGGLMDLEGATMLGYEFGNAAGDPNATVNYVGNTVSWGSSTTVPEGDYGVYLVMTTNLQDYQIVSLGMSSVTGTSFSLTNSGQDFLDNYWIAEALTGIVFLKDDGDCVITQSDTYSVLLNFDFGL